MAALLSFCLESSPSAGSARRKKCMATPSLPERPVDPRRYFESVEERRAILPDRKPVCLYLETTNRCNLLCTTCPRTYEQLEPEADMSWDLFTSIVSQFSSVKRVVLHGVG